jgi:pyrrolidone-carboxylate peptidase
MGARRLLAILLTLSAACSLPACAADDDAGTDDDAAGSEDEVRVDTRSPAARRQYDANVAFATSYSPRCARGATDRPRVLVTGFGRFMSIGNNATGRIVSTLVPSAPYPETTAPAAGEVDPPAPQLSVGTSTIDLPGVGAVDVCGMILPVYWDLAAILISKELDAFEPSLVLMNGVAGARQPIWIELGATNRAAKLDDGSNQLRPATGPNDDFAKIVETAPRSEDARGNLLGWRAVESAAREAVVRHADDRENGVRFGDLLPGVKLAGFPRSSNTYLCNNVTYVTGYLMSHPNREVRLLRASPPERGKTNLVRVKQSKDFRATPRVFVHWPSELAGVHHRAGAEVMKSILAAQLAALARGEPPTVGDNALADPTLQGGDFF